MMDIIAIATCFTLAIYAIGSILTFWNFYKDYLFLKDEIDNLKEKMSMIESKENENEEE